MTNKIPELVIGDPHQQPGLVDRIPEGVGPKQIVNFYHYSLFPEQKAYCAKCGARRHRDGFTVELDDGTLALAGSTCGGDLWGERWNTVHRSFQTRLHAAGYIMDARKVLSELEGVRLALETSWRPVVSMLNKHQNRFKNWMHPLYAALRTAALRSDHCLERPGREPILVEGWAYFATEDILRRFQKALDQIDAAIAAGKGHETALGARTVNIAEARHELDAIAHAHRALRIFFAESSMDLAIIVETVNLSITGTDERPYRAQGQGVMDIASEKVIDLPRDYPLLATEPLRKLRDLK
jgi:hypothetical protein